MVGYCFRVVVGTVLATTSLAAVAAAPGAAPAAQLNKTGKQTRVTAMHAHGASQPVAAGVARSAIVAPLAAKPLPAAQAATVGLPGFIIDRQFGGISLIDTLALGTGSIPPDMGGASNGLQVMQAINGGYAIYDVAGHLQRAIRTDDDFWLRAGIPAAIVGEGLSDPRIVFDVASQRFFVVEITVNQPSPDNPTASNAILIAASRTSNPLDGFRAINIRLKPGVLGDFPTLGVNADAVTVSTNNFGLSGFTDLSLFTVPKADLLNSPARPTNVTRFDSLSAFDGGATFGYGFALHAASSADPGDGTMDLVAVSGTQFNRFATSRLLGVGAPRAGLSPARAIFTRFDGIPNAGRQPSGTSYDNSDDRVSANVKKVGRYLFVVNTVNKNQDFSQTAGLKNPPEDDGGAGEGGVLDVSPPAPSAAPAAATSTQFGNAVHWAIIDTVTNKVLIERQIVDPSNKIDYSYPSIDANANGRFVIAYNGSSANMNISAYATICDFNTATVKVVCTAPKLLYAGLDSDYSLGNPVRWGDYSAVQLDPANGSAFWLFQEVPGVRQLNASGVLRPRWATVITHMVTTDPL